MQISEEALDKEKIDKKNGKADKSRVFF